MTSRRTLIPGIVVVATMLGPAGAVAQNPDPAATPAPSSRVADALKFLAGGAVALATHEGAHLAFDEIFDAQPRVVSVHFGPIPFFAISPGRPLSPRRLYAVAASGIWTHAVTSELLLAKHDDLRHEHAPFAKGMLAFDVLTSAGYAAIAFAKAGPVERDTLGMAEGLGVSERAIGVLVLAPAVLDVYRYYRPESRWARWATRAVEAASVVLVVKP